MANLVQGVEIVQASVSGWPINTVLEVSATQSGRLYLVLDEQIVSCSADRTESQDGNQSNKIVIPLSSEHLKIINNGCQYSVRNEDDYDIFTGNTKIQKENSMISTEVGQYENAKILLASLIKSLISSGYKSHDPRDGVLTGSGYQTIELSNEIIDGFRSSDRMFAFGGIEIAGKYVVDLGSNYGEVVRTLRKAGAKGASGVEYDKMFNLIARLVDALNETTGTKYVTADVTKDDILESADIYSCLSVFRFIEGRLKEIAAATRDLAVIETHVVNDRMDLERYTSKVRMFFSDVAYIGNAEWHVGASAGHRALLWASNNKALLIQSIFQRAGTMRGHPSLGRLDLRGTIPAVKSIQLSSFRGRENISDLISGTISLDELRRSALSQLDSRTEFGAMGYWLCFLVGYVEWKSANGHVRDDNTYLYALRRIIKSDANYDGPIASSDASFLPCRALWRLISFDDIFEGRMVEPALILVTHDNENAPIDVRVSGRRIQTNKLDGYHRIAAALMCGLIEFPVLDIELIP